MLMKQNLLLILFCLFIVFTSKAQSLQIVEANTAVVGTIGEELSGGVKVKNISENAVEIKVEKLDVNILDDQKAYFKFDNTITPSRKAISTNSKLVKPGSIFNSFTAFLSTDFDQGQSDVTYRFFNANNQEDYTDVTINYSVSDQFNNDKLFANNNIIISYLYPNPATAFVTFDYRLSHTSPKALIIIRDVLGNKVKSYELESIKSQLKFPINDLTPSIYTYTLYLGEQSVVTQKFLVKR